MFLDAHTHLNSPQLFPSRKEHISDFEKLWWKALINIWADEKYNKNGITISREYLWNSFVKCTIGLHPFEVVIGNIKSNNLDEKISELKKIYLCGKDYGKTDLYKGKKINVEYESANPTGLLHLGHGRNAAIGDTLANIYQWCGADITREYYFNNAGNQMNNLTKSIYARYMQIVEDENFPFPDDGYHGSYVKNIAEELHSKHGKTLTSFDDKNTFNIIKTFGETWCFDKIKTTLKKMNVQQEVFFNEDSLYKDGKIKEVAKYLEIEKELYPIKDF